MASAPIVRQLSLSECASAFIAIPQVQGRLEAQGKAWRAALKNWPRIFRWNAASSPDLCRGHWGRNGASGPRKSREGASYSGPPPPPPHRASTWNNLSAFTGFVR